MEYEVFSYVEHQKADGDWRNPVRTWKRDARKHKKTSSDYEKFRFYDQIVATVEHKGKLIELRSTKFNYSREYSHEHCSTMV